ncbi:MAG: alpha/beta hydrolase family protein [Planctomycetota bacterium]|jgi:pimeloyl-ACP methyl ester carboxylesterase
MHNSRTILAVVLCASLRAQAGFVENPELPPMFKQLDVARPDGSSATVFVGDFDGSFATRKPLLIYLEGSGAMSQFIRSGKMTGYGIYGLVAERASDRFHVATVEKRGVPFGWRVEQIGSAVGASEEYQRHATLDGRVAEVRLALTALLSQPTVDPTRVVLIGHSEGADVAAVVAGRDDRVTHVACLAGGGAPQFFDSFVSRRKKLRASGATAEEVAKELGELEQQIRTILAAPDSIDDFWRGHPYRRWATFAAQATADELVHTSAKVFVAQGSEDESVPMESFDYLVVRLLADGFGGESVESGAGLMEVIEEVIDWSGR